MSQVVLVIGLLLMASQTAFAQRQQLEEKVAAMADIARRIKPIPVEPLDTLLPFTVEITDKLGDFESWENLNVSIGETFLKYNLNEHNDKTATTLIFRTDQPGWYDYRIHGRCLHRDGNLYTISGRGRFLVEEVQKNYGLYVLYIDEENKHILAYFKESP